MNNNRNEKSFSLKSEVEKIAQEKNILWEESQRKRESFKKSGNILTPLSILVLLFIVPVFNIFNIKSPGELLIGVVILVFLIWFWYKIFRSLFLSGNLISPWVVGLIEKAKEISTGNLKNSKATTNLLMGALFIFFGLMLFLANPTDTFGKGLSYGLGAMFLFLGTIGITHYIIAKKPRRVLFLLKNNRIINFIILLLVSAFCFFVAKSIVGAIIIQMG